jgi:S1-C subfamily serine protease
MRSRPLALVSLVLAIVAPAVSGAATRDTVERALRDASVLVGTGCSGVLADGPDLVLTAAHCVVGRASLALRFSTGVARTGWVVAVDRVADQALLLLEEPVAITPLALARGPAIAETVLYFEGNPHAPRFQEAKLERVGSCPSLPGLSNALFTTIAGVPGDSGAPIVDAAAHVVGLVHGGARCQIATPAATLRRLIDRFFEQEELELPAG